MTGSLSSRQTPPKGLNTLQARSVTELDATPYTASRTALGFIKRRSFYLWLLFGGATVLFCLAKFPLMSAYGMQKMMGPGEWFWYSQRFYQNAMRLHLGAILPCGILAVFQFIPALRNKYPKAHRIVGRLVFITLLIGNVGGACIARHAFGGSMSTQTVVFALIVMTSYGGWRAYSAIKRRQIAEHRRWCLRTMFWMGTAITARFILPLLLQLTRTDDYYTVFRCDELEATMNKVNDTSFSVKYPACQETTSTASRNVVPVLASFSSYEEVASALRLFFGSSVWLALLIHTLGIEYYLSLSSPHDRIPMKAE